MNFFARNILLIHLSLLVIALGWIHGGTRPDLLVPVVPWLTLLILEWLLVFPQGKSSETLAETRRRVWRALAREPLTYVALLLTLLLVIPLFNVAMPPVFDDATGQWTFFKPAVTWLPYCVNIEHHAVLLLWFPPALVAALAAKHGLLKRSKRILLEVICWNGAALAVLGFAQLLSGTDKVLWLTPMPAYFFSSFGYPNFAGAYFTLMAGLSFGLWFHQATEAAGLAPFATGDGDDDPMWLVTHRLLLPTALSFAAAIASLSRAAILLSALVFVVLTGYMLVAIWKRVDAAVRISLVAAVLALIFALGVSLAVFELDKLKAEILTITPEAVVARVTGRAYYHARVAKAIFRDHPVFGVGGWGYPRYVSAYMTPEDFHRMQVTGGANVHNDSLQFLAEQGAVGYGLLVMAALLLVAPLWWQAGRLLQIKAPASDWPERASGGRLNRVPAPLVAVWVATGATVCHSMGDLPFRSPAILVAWVLALACAPGWLPVIRSQKERSKA